MSMIQHVQTEFSGSLIDRKIADHDGKHCTNFFVFFSLLNVDDNWLLMVAYFLSKSMTDGVQIHYSWTEFIELLVCYSKTSFNKNVVNRNINSYVAVLYLM